MSEINFLNQRHLLHQKVNQRDLLIFRVGVGMFILSVLITLGGIGLNLYLTQEVNQTAAKQAEVRQAITSDQKLETEFLIFSNKLKLTADIFTKRSNKQEALAFLSNLFGSEVFIGGISYNKDSELLAVSLVSENVFNLEKLFDLLSTQEVKNNFASISKSGLRRADDGTYTSDVTLGLKKDVLGINSTASQSAKPTP